LEQLAFCALWQCSYSLDKKKLSWMKERLEEKRKKEKENFKLNTVLLVMGTL